MFCYMKKIIFSAKSSSLFSKTVAFLIFSLFFSVVSAHAEMLSIKGDKVNLRKGPGKTYGIISEYDSGFPVEILERKGNWVKIKDFEEDIGWIEKSFLINSLQTIVKANRNKDESINIRKEPGSDSPIVGKAYYGVVFKVLRIQSGWVEVRHESGLTGWVSSNLLWGF